MIGLTLVSHLASQLLTEPTSLHLLLLVCTPFEKSSNPALFKRTLAQLVPSNLLSTMMGSPHSLDTTSVILSRRTGAMLLLPIQPHEPLTARTMVSRRICDLELIGILNKMDAHLQMQPATTPTGR